MPTIRWPSHAHLSSTLHFGAKFACVLLLLCLTLFAALSDAFNKEISNQPTLTMKLSTALVLLATGTTNAFVVPSSTTSVTTSSTSALCAEIRPPSKKNEVLEFGWDGTTALGGAVVDSKPARMLDEIRASGETQNSACDLFNANLGE